MFVAFSLSFWISAVVPTATMVCSRMARASAVGLALSPVQMRPLMKMRSAFSAALVGAATPRATARTTKARPFTTAPH